MKNRQIKSILGVVFALVFLTSCDVDRDSNRCPILIGVPATAVTGPTEAAINQEITLAVSYKIAAACGGFSRFYNESAILTEKVITVNALYDACNCDEVYTTQTEPYKFKAVAAGVYTLKFKKTNETFVTHVVTVE